MRRCLDKSWSGASNPRATWHSCGERIVGLPVWGNGRCAIPWAAEKQEAGSTFWRWRQLLLACVADPVCRSGSAIYLSRAGATNPSELRLQLPPRRVCGSLSVPAVSPDGRYVAFVANSNDRGSGTLWLRPLSSDRAIGARGIGGRDAPLLVARSSLRLHFFAGERLKRVARDGGDVRELSAYWSRGLWLDDGTILFAPTASRRVQSQR